jgi:hypothetical protein
VRAVERDRAQRLVIGHAAGPDEGERPVDLAGDRLVALAELGGAHEIAVPVVHRVQVGQAATEVGPQHVHRRGGVGVRPDHALRVGRTRLDRGLQRVDQVAPVRRQAEHVQLL